MRSLVPIAWIVVHGSLTAQRLVVPDNHNFMESAVYGTNAGDANQWSGTSGKRFQIVYEASHFLGNAGIPAGGVLVTRLRFRGEDGEANLGGQTYSGVVVQLGKTALTGATTTATFGSPTGGGPGTAGSNRDPAVTTLGPAGTATTLTVAPSVGSCPNNWCIEIDIAAIGASFVYDPHDPTQPNLLIDVTAPTAPTQAPPQTMIPIQDTSAHGAGIRGRSVWTSSPTSPSGIVDASPPIVGIEFNGAGGWPGELPARAESIGSGCGGQHATFYQAFAQDQAFDLGSGLTLTPDVYPSPNHYVVTAGTPPVDLVQLGAAPATTADDANVTHPLGFLVTPFQYPGGSTATIVANTNGFVWLDPSMTVADLYQPTLGNLLGIAGDFTARLMPFWTDLTADRNAGMGTLAGLHVATVPESTPGAGDAVCYVTWRDMGSFRTPVTGGSPTVYGHQVFNVQCVLHEATGVVEFRYGTMQPFVSTLWSDTMENAAIVGFTRGRISNAPLVASRDPGSRDLSHELPFATAIEGTASNAWLSAVASPIAGSVHQTGRMFAGQSLLWNLAHVPAGYAIALLNLDLAAVQPGVTLPPTFGILAPGCMLSTSTPPLILGWEVWFAFAGGTLAGTLPLTVPPGWEGITITAQAIGLDLAGGPFLVPWTSNTIRYTVGLD